MPAAAQNTNQPTNAFDTRRSTTPSRPINNLNPHASTR